MDFSSTQERVYRFATCYRNTTNIYKGLTGKGIYSCQEKLSLNTEISDTTAKENPMNIISLLNRKFKTRSKSKISVFKYIDCLNIIYAKLSQIHASLKKLKMETSVFKFLS